MILEPDAKRKDCFAQFAALVSRLVLWRVSWLKIVQLLMKRSQPVPHGNSFLGSFI